VQLGEVAGAAGLERYLLHSLEQVGRGGIPLVTAALAAPARLGELDRLCDASLTNHVANRASRAQGRAWIAAAAAAFGGALRELRMRIREDAGLSGHLSPVFGVVSAALDIPREESRRLFLFLHLRGLVSSAVRLSLIGPMEGQAMQYRLSDALLAVEARSAALTEEDIASASPLLDLFQGHHDRLYSRLFSS
jgi:urease accessory protein